MGQAWCQLLLGQLCGGPPWPHRRASGARCRLDAMSWLSPSSRARAAHRGRSRAQASRGSTAAPEQPAPEQPAPGRAALTRRRARGRCAEGYTATDIIARLRRMQGYNVLHPIGWDAFGLPAEQYALQTGTHPRVTTERNIARFRQQLQALGAARGARHSREGSLLGRLVCLLYCAFIFRRAAWRHGRPGLRECMCADIMKMRFFKRAPGLWQAVNFTHDTVAPAAPAVPARAFTSQVPTRHSAGSNGRRAAGFSYDWDREVCTTDPGYYRWTQWIILQLFARGLAYQAEVPVNWCPALGTVLANEEVIEGRSERGGHPVVRLPMKQARPRCLLCRVQATGLGTSPAAAALTGACLRERHAPRGKRPGRPASDCRGHAQRPCACRRHIVSALGAVCLSTSGR